MWRIFKLFALLVFATGLFVVYQISYGYEKAFPRTAAGVIEIKRIPASVIIESGPSDKYFEDSGSLFMPLFSFIDSNGIPMTTPVESDIEGGRMRFFLDKASHGRKDLKSNELVRLADMPERTVLALGANGAYTKENFYERKKEAEAWLAEHPEWEAVGGAYAVYWDSPWIPGFMKNSEVHVQVKERVSK